MQPGVVEGSLIGYPSGAETTRRYPDGYYYTEWIQVRFVLGVFRMRRDALLDLADTLLTYSSDLPLVDNAPSAVSNHKE